ncbi:hypothetical protein TVAG_109120 [Trichomonas vaginalis G3]|uniref:Uncharacterized protein n=1 Tax=Trichomonas vaginalis (strain ATCC PRA-98 / G3) TaxID=412133 RepID=A2G1N3_TRIV3|nr:hypothetical protein TVAGG3_0884460 [Trichomonas vaginalis G3]EAX88937.1 hypothetical protein TVAG_109120 [Trichomonas vaginalis G3]KAI5502285.1 hypothetical protein TVAGG3_0884460 [Trichomonas vaginalis G3]|eukprot:XP_001301867.1 hypothetical protein [Trichomonas vaginalis G3]
MASVSSFIRSLKKEFCPLVGDTYCNHPSLYIYLALNILMLLPYFYCVATLFRKLKFEVRNKVMPGLFYTIATSIYNLASWFTDYALNYNFHGNDQDYFFKESFMWDDLSKLSKIMFLHQIALVMLAFENKFGKILKYFNYLMFFIFGFRFIGKFIIQFIPNAYPYEIPVLKYVLYNLNPAYFSAIYTSLYILMVVILSFCFVFSKIKNYLPSGILHQIYLATYFLVFGLLSTEAIQGFRYGKLFMKIRETDLSMYNYVRFIVSFYVKYCVDYPIFIIIWILSAPNYNEAKTNDDILNSSLGILE